MPAVPLTPQKKARPTGGTAEIRRVQELLGSVLPVRCGPTMGHPALLSQAVCRGRRGRDTGASAMPDEARPHGDPREARDRRTCHWEGSRTRRQQRLRPLLDRKKNEPQSSPGSAQRPNWPRTRHRPARLAFQKRRERCYSRQTDRSRNCPTRTGAARPSRWCQPCTEHSGRPVSLALSGWQDWR